jgi:prepilin-type N-terminal cleavage/methylation domain-containing protein
MTDILSGIKSPGARRLTVVKLKTGNNLGFTLPEVMIVLCIMAVMTLIAVPAFMNLLPGMRLNSSARQAFMAMARARQGAVSSNTDAYVKFDTIGNSIKVWLDNGPGAAKGNGAKDASEPYIFERVTDEGVIFAFRYPSDTVGFNSRGLPISKSYYLSNYLAYFLWLQNSEGKYKSIIINPVGNIKIS